MPFVEPFWLAWQRRHGGGYFKLIEGDGRGCSFYCAKYAAKRGEVYFSSGLEQYRSGDVEARRPALTLFPLEERDGAGVRDVPMGDGGGSR